MPGTGTDLSTLLCNGRGAKREGKEKKIQKDEDIQQNNILEEKRDYGRQSKGGRDRENQP